MGKTGVAVLLALMASASAFTGPMMATRAIAKKPVKSAGTWAATKKVVAKKAPVKKAATKKVVAKKAPAPSITSDTGGYPSFSTGAEKFKIKGISGGGNKAPVWKWDVPDFSDPKLQKERDPAFYAAAAKTRLTKGKADFVYDDGLTEIERKQRVTIPIFLSGSAKSQIDPTAIANDIEGVDYFGLSGDRFQLLMISIFALFTLVGCLSGNLQL